MIRPVTLHTGFFQNRFDKLFELSDSVFRLSLFDRRGSSILLPISGPGSTLRLKLFQCKRRRGIDGHFVLSTAQTGASAEDQTKQQRKPDPVLNVHSS